MDEEKDLGVDLLAKLAKASTGYSYDDVINASTSLFISVVKRGCPTAEHAEQAYDDIVARLRESLLARYATEPRRNGPASKNQTVQAGLVKNRSRAH